MCLLKNDGTVDNNVHSNKTPGNKTRERCECQRNCHGKQVQVQIISRTFFSGEQVTSFVSSDKPLLNFAHTKKQQPGLSEISPIVGE